MRPCPTCGVTTNDEIIDPRTVTIEWIEQNPHHAQTMLRLLAAEVFDVESLKEQYDQLLARVRATPTPPALT